MKLDTEKVQPASLLSRFVAAAIDFGLVVILSIFSSMIVYSIVQNSKTKLADTLELETQNISSSHLGKLDKGQYKSYTSDEYFTKTENGYQIIDSLSYFYTIYLAGDEAKASTGDIVAINAKDNMTIDGNYLFDGGKNIIVKNSILNSKDSFWNTENVTVINSKINGEYLAWNSRNITFIDCEISSLQALCYIKGLKMINCKLLDSSLTFEYCEDIDAQIVDKVVSIKNTSSGVIKVKGVNELIIDENKRGEAKIIIEE